MTKIVLSNILTISISKQFLYFDGSYFIFQVIQTKVKENYNMKYWIKKCDPGVVSCFVAQVREVGKLF